MDISKIRPSLFDPRKASTDEPGSVEFEQPSRGDSPPEDSERKVGHLDTPEKDEDILGVDVDHLIDRSDASNAVEREDEKENEGDGHIGQTGNRHADRKAS